MRKSPPRTWAELVRQREGDRHEEAKRPADARQGRQKALLRRPKPEEVLALQTAVVGLPAPVREHRFHPERAWRFDLAWPDRFIAVEVEGGAFSEGRHTRGAGFREDIVKYAEAMSLGWRVLRVMPEHIKTGRALQWIEMIFGARAPHLDTTCGTSSPSSTGSAASPTRA